MNDATRDPDSAHPRRPFDSLRRRSPNRVILCASTHRLDGTTTHRRRTEQQAFPVSTAAAPLVAVSDATTSSRLVVRPLLVSVEQAAGLLGIGRTTLYELIRRGEVRPIRIGRSVRIPRRELEAFVERLIADTDASV